LVYSPRQWQPGTQVCGTKQKLIGQKTMKLFTLFVLAVSLVLVGCDKPAEKSGGDGKSTNAAPAKP